jgi:hypothetical protein
LPKKAFMGGVSDADFALLYNRLWFVNRHRGRRPLPQKFLGKAGFGGQGSGFSVQDINFLNLEP